MAHAADEPVAATSRGGEPTLERTIGWKQMAFYGVGDMLGAGIYGLVGKAAGEMGNAVWLAFAVDGRGHAHRPLLRVDRLALSARRRRGLRHAARLWHAAAVLRRRPGRDRARA